MLLHYLFMLIKSLTIFNSKAKFKGKHFIC